MHQRRNAMKHRGTLVGANKKKARPTRKSKSKISKSKSQSQSKSKSKSKSQSQSQSRSSISKDRDRFQFYTNSPWINQHIKNTSTTGINYHHPVNLHKSTTTLASTDDCKSNKSSDSAALLIHDTMKTFAWKIKRESKESSFNKKPGRETSTSGSVLKHQKNQISNQLVAKRKQKRRTDSDPQHVVTPFIVLFHGYIWHRVVARGAFSILYEASRLFISLGRVACKHVKLETGNPGKFAWDIDARWRLLMQKKFLEEEIQILKQVKHVNIIKLYEIIIHENQDFYFMMKFASNGTILDYLYKFWMKPLPETYAKRWMGQLMEALKYLHEEHQILHRDLKLDNFLLDEKFEALLSDFGLAVRVNNPDHRKVMNLISIQCGTPEYMAPEINLQQGSSSLIGGNNNIDMDDDAAKSLLQMLLQHCDPFKADIYSMGVCLFEMVNYYRPFVWSSMNGGFGYFSYLGGASNKLLWQQQNRRYKFNQKIYLTEYCQDLVNKMLDPKPQTRPNARQVLEHYWFRYSTR